MVKRAATSKYHGAKRARFGTRVARSVRAAIRNRRRAFVRRWFPPLKGSRAASYRRRFYRRRRFIGQNINAPGAKYLTIKCETDYAMAWNCTALAPVPTPIETQSATDHWIPDKDNVNVYVRQTWNAFRRHKLIGYRVKYKNFRTIQTTTVFGGTVVTPPMQTNELYSVNTTPMENYRVLYWFRGTRNRTTQPGEGDEEEWKKLQIRGGKGFIYRSITVPKNRMESVDLSYNNFYDTFSNFNNFEFYMNQEACINTPTTTGRDLNDMPVADVLLMPDPPYPQAWYHNMSAIDNQLVGRCNITMMFEVEVTSIWKLTQPVPGNAY